MVPLLERLAGFAERVALVSDGVPHTYGELDERARAVARALSARGLERGDRVAMALSPSFEFASTLLGVWRAGGVAVPLALSHPEGELAYVLDDIRPRLAVAHGALRERLTPLSAARELPLLDVDALADGAGDDAALPDVALADDALILYTSGTTSRPKGVVLSHGNLDAQVRGLTTAWRWCADDHILLVLPLHHVHGLVNVVLCALFSGAKCTMHPRFDATLVFEAFLHDALTLFMAVPTIYERLIAHFDAAGDDLRERFSEAARSLRLMVSGSAALPVQTLERWRDVTAHTLLERYGMTEIGMALSNPYDGERVPGAVGSPLPHAEVRLVDEGGAALPDGDGRGEIEVRGPAVFGRYFEREEATRDAFTDDGWFKTGDLAERRDGVYRILGRKSVDIIKSGGEKVSALEIEHVLLDHPAILECAIIGVPDPKWGEAVALAAVLRPAHALSLDDVRDFARARLAPYKLPTRLLVVDALPRNALGKVQKPKLAPLFDGSAA